MFRTIIESPEVKGIIDSTCNSNNRLEEAWDGLKWLLARNPQVGKPFGFGNKVLIHKQAGQGNIPAITVLYSYDDDNVELKAIRLTNANEQSEVLELKAADSN